MFADGNELNKRVKFYGFCQKLQRVLIYSDVYLEFPKKHSKAITDIYLLAFPSR